MNVTKTLYSLMSWGNLCGILAIWRAGGERRRPRCLRCRHSRELGSHRGRGLAEIPEW